MGDSDDRNVPLGLDDYLMESMLEIARRALSFVQKDAVLVALTYSWVLKRRRAELAAETRLAQNDSGKSGHVAPVQVLSGSAPFVVNLANFRSFS